MIKNIFFLTFSLFLSVPSFACELPAGEEIKGGCSYDCNFFYRFRLATTAWGLGYKTKIIDLQSQPDLKEALADIDGILLPGGADIDPKYYLDNVSSELQDYTRKNINLVKFTKEGERRDPFEYSLVKLYSEDETYKDLPMLGICRGFQMMSVAQGIPLYLDIKTELGIRNRRNLFDKIYVTDKTSLMSSIYQRGTFKGYELHHQGIRVPYYLEHQAQYPLTKVTAYSNDNKIAEAIEYTHRTALGVQYHPERSFSGASRPVLQWFLKKACEYKISMKEVK